MPANEGRYLSFPCCSLLRIAIASVAEAMVLRHPSCSQLSVKKNVVTCMSRDVKLQYCS